MGRNRLEHVENNAECMDATHVLLRYSKLETV
jgi:hypothetical protein